MELQLSSDVLTSLEESKAIEGAMECGDDDICSKSKMVINGSSVGFLHNTGEDSGGANEGFRTYKRRRQSRSASKSQDEGATSTKTTSQIEEETLKEPLPVEVDNVKNSCESVSLLSMNFHNNKNDSPNASLRQWRNILLRHMYQSLVVNGGLQGCIQDALLSHPEIDCGTKAKECVSTDESREGGPSASGLMLNGVDAICNGSKDERNQQTITERCQQTFYNMITSEKFALLSKLLCESFQGMRNDDLFHLNTMNSRMKEGTYECSPSLFLLDIEAIWRKLQVIGTEMTCLARSLSDMSRTSYSDLVGGALKCTFEVGKGEESDSHTKPEQRNTNKIHTCRSCGGKAHGRDCLVCNSCEDLYHASCIEPAAKLIPSKSWCCSAFTQTKSGSLHEDCVVCERLEALRQQANLVDVDAIPANEETHKETEGSSDCSREKDSRICKICRSEVREDEEAWLCGHPYCLNKYYHSRCLTPKESKLYGPRWYCPSCLCRVCLTDRDDDKIVLCDGCDHAYHLYCMNPSRTTIPKGKWFCKKCDKDIQKIRSVRRAYEKMKREYGEVKTCCQTGKEQNWQGDRYSNKGTGMDMLLSAANTLHFAENVAAMEEKN